MSPRRRGYSFTTRTPPKTMPLHLRRRRTDYWLLYRWANGVAAYYGAPVYLVGSATRHLNKDPRDWDIRVMLPAAEFARRFGDPEQWAREGETGNYTRVRWRWSDECTKRAKEGFDRTRKNIDFQIYPIGHARRHYKHGKRVRLDTRRAKTPRRYGKRLA